MTSTVANRADRVIGRCRELAQCTEVPGETTRLFLSPPVHTVHALVRGWMEAAGMAVRVDAIGNLHGVYAATEPNAPRLLIASHLDTVPNAGAFDGILGVLLGVAVVEELRGERLPFAIEVIGFSEEEGVRFNKPFLGSLALVGKLDAETLGRTDPRGISVFEALNEFGLSHLPMEEAAADERVFAYLEFHIEQGPVLESENRSLGVVDAIAGQTRLRLVFTGQANHAGTTPMRLRHDAMVAAAHWIVEVEQYASSREGLVATVGRIEAKPGAVNVIPGEVTVSLDVRHTQDEVRHTAISTLLSCAELAASSRGVAVAATKLHEQAAVPMNVRLIELLTAAAEKAGFPADTMTSGAGHDAMIVAEKIPSVMLFLRSPGGLSHHPDENVLPQDVEAALATAIKFLTQLSNAAAVGYRL
ncbi:allantoate amidohydrolase [Granulicella arctica]|uniref:Allantoate deiminase n=1 Tax=Granulicella arctica TaxID=940613 RepID=A0A7Y9PGE7_9BACT|nr:allantoate amidohydrolase [Granulicella arctica]NYF79411.1 allantoate deiminase [Granulicella arctica]